MVIPHGQGLHIFIVGDGVDHLQEGNILPVKTTKEIAYKTHEGRGIHPQFHVHYFTIGVPYFIRIKVFRFCAFYCAAFFSQLAGELFQCQSGFLCDRNPAKIIHPGDAQCFQFTLIRIGQRDVRYVLIFVIRAGDHPQAEFQILYGSRQGTA